MAAGRRHKFKAKMAYPSVEAACDGIPCMLLFANCANRALCGALRFNASFLCLPCKKRVMPYPFSSASGIVREYNCERPHKHPRQLINHRHLLKDLVYILKGSQKGHMLIAYPGSIVYIQVWEAISKSPAKHVALEPDCSC